MSTYRERRERRAEKRREWAEGRQQKADALRAQNEPYRGDWAFATQPGRIPERERANARDERAHEHAAMASKHEQAAAGIERQLERSIYDDDPDAIERLTGRVAELEARRDRIKGANKALRKLLKTTPEPSSTDLARCGFRDDEIKDLRILAEMRRRWAGYPLTNMGAAIRHNQQRIERLKGAAA